MQDDRGFYYTPSLQEPETRMYVRKNDGSIEFRLWNPHHPEVWDKHQWLPYEVIKNAADMYRQMNKDRNPMALYDIEIARRLIADGE
ncbi:MAG: hypothetical protein F6K17_19520 [Okeania sp. SIO3C4]|nr:hypothetical protein [Okeania sp. SIO3C4]